MCVTHPHLLLIRILTLLEQFCHIAINILHIKNWLKLETRAIAIGVGMSLRNLSGKYHCRPNRGRESALAIFCGRQGILIQLYHTGVPRRLPDYNSVLDHVACLKAELLSRTVLSNENGEFYTSMIHAVNITSTADPNWV